jgi:hypothetical protein
VLRIACDLRSQGDTVAQSFYTSLRAARRALSGSSGRAASLDSSNSLFNEMARRSVADLHMLITQTGHVPTGLPGYLGSAPHLDATVF